MQAAWKEASQTTNAALLPGDWWQIFNDADLNALETCAIEAATGNALRSAEILYQEKMNVCQGLWSANGIHGVSNTVAGKD